MIVMTSQDSERVNGLLAPADVVTHIYVHSLTNGLTLYTK